MDASPPTATGSGSLPPPDASAPPASPTAPRALTPADRAAPVVLYDGACGLCSRSVQWVLARDVRGVFRFAALQSALGREMLIRHERDPDELSTFAVLIPPGAPGAPAGGGERLLVRSRAAAYLLSRMPRGWPVLGTALRLIPRPIADWGYGFIARRRYRWFGAVDACMLPTPAARARFLDIPPPRSAPPG